MPSSWERSRLFRVWSEVRILQIGQIHPLHLGAIQTIELDQIVLLADAETSPGMAGTATAAVQRAVRVVHLANRLEPLLRRKLHRTCLFFHSTPVPFLINTP
jgi:hypothetical protein